MCGGHDTAIFTMIYLNLLTLWFHKIFQLIFLKQSSWPKTLYLGKFSYTFSVTVPWSTYEQLLTWICYCVSNQKWILTGYFGFLFWFSSAILLSKMKSLFLNLYTSSQWVTALLQLPIHHGKCALIYNFRWWSFDTPFERTGVLNSK